MGSTSHARRKEKCPKHREKAREELDYAYIRNAYCESQSFVAKMMRVVQQCT
jgi:hypothetical protein